MKLNKLHTFHSHSAAVYGLSAGEKKETFFTASGDHFVVEWNLQSMQQERFAVNIGQPVYSILYIADHHLLVAGNSLGAFHVIDIANRAELRMIAVHEKGIYDLVYDADNAQMVVAGGDGALSIWSVPEFEMIRRIPICSEKLRQIAIHPVTRNYAIACGDGNIRIFEPEFFNETHTLMAHEDGATSVAWHPSKPVLLSGGKDAWLRSWKTDDHYKQALAIPAHQFAIYSIVFHPEKKILVTASRDKTIKIWSAESLEPIQRLDSKSGGHSHSVNKLIWCNDYLISCGDDRQVIVWQEN